MAAAPASVLLEIACFDLASAFDAAEAGADRLELCAGAREGGLTPSPALVRAVRHRVGLPLAAMVRTRGGDFCYTPAEQRVMRDEAAALLDAGADVLVFGALRPDGGVDEDALAHVLALGAPVTFHRAFDAAPDPHAALDVLAAAGVARVLAAGGPGPAADHLPALAALVRHAAGRLGVMPGGGVRAAHVRALVAATGVGEVHSAARRTVGPAHPHGEARDAVDPAEVAALRRRLDGGAPGCGPVRAVPRGA